MSDSFSRAMWSLLLVAILASALKQGFDKTVDAIDRNTVACTP